MSNGIRFSRKQPGPVANDQLKQMLGVLLSERFKLALRHETRDRQMTVMTLGKKDPKLTPSQGDGEMAIYPEYRRTVFRTTTMAELAAFLSGGGPTLIDMTGLKGRFDFALDHGRYVDPADENQSPMRMRNNAMRLAVQEELGLKLEIRKVPIDTLVIEHAQQIPTEN